MGHSILRGHFFLRRSLEVYCTVGFTGCVWLPDLLHPDLKQLLSIVGKEGAHV